MIWAGLEDPCKNADELHSADPQIEQFVIVAEQWAENLGDEEMKVADVVKKAQSNEGLKAALMTVAEGKGRDIDTNRLGYWLRKYKDRPIDGFKFTSRVAHGRTKMWRLEQGGVDDRDRDGQIVHFRPQR